MALFPSWFLSQDTKTNLKLKNIFPLGVVEPDFIREDVTNTFKKILTDTIERSHKIPKELSISIYDNFLQTEADKGLITLLSEAMYNQNDLFLVYKENVLRLATQEEKELIEKDYDEKRKSSHGIYLSFKDYNLSKLLRIYSAFEYCLLGSLNKSLNLSNALQLKISGIRNSVNIMDSKVAIDQAKEMAESLGEGNDILLDALDVIETADVNTEPIERAMEFLNGKKAYLLNAPQSYITGEQTGGIGSTGEGDTKAIDRCLRLFFTSIIQPVFKELFNINLEFKSHDFRNMATALEVLRTLDLASDDILSTESKREIIARVFDLDLSDEKRRLEKEAKEREELFKDEFQDDDDGEADRIKRIPKSRVWQDIV